MIVISPLSCMFFGPSPSLQSWARVTALVSVVLQLYERRPHLARKLVSSANKAPAAYFNNFQPILAHHPDSDANSAGETDPDFEHASRASKSLIESHNPTDSPVN
jgi:hypothetical protein